MNTNSSEDIQYSFETTSLWRLKTRLQNTGWLQYIPPFTGGLLLTLISRCLQWYLRASSNLPSSIGAAGKLLIAIGIFDIVTLKFNIRPPELLPKRRDDNEDLCSIMRQRHSCRSFQPRKLLDYDREEILQLAQFESKQTLGTSQIRFEYVDSPLRAWPAVNAQEFLVAIGPAKYDRMAMVDVGRSLQAVVIHATKMGLATCWIGPGADHDSIRTTLKARGRYDSERDHMICVCAIGYKSVLIPFALRFLMNAMSHIRKPYNELFFSDVNFQEPLDMTRYPFNKYAKCYEAARWSPSSYNAQPTQCLGTWDETRDAVRFDFYSSTKSRYYAPIAAGIWLCDWETACESIGIKGRFIVLSQQERGIECFDGDDDHPSQPTYNISWIEVQDYNS